MRKTIVIVFILSLLLSFTEVVNVNAYSCFQPNDAMFPTVSWSKDIMNIRSVWARDYFGKNSAYTPRIAVIDSGLVGTGIQGLKHDDLNYNNVEGGKNFQSSIEDNNTEDIFGHGTFVAGIISASINNKHGIAGNMPDAIIVPYKCYNRPINLKVSNVVSCINDAVKNDVDVINLSLSVGIKTKTLNEAIQKAANMGIIICAAAGNYGEKDLCYPASYSGVISVGSINKDGIKSKFSNYNKMVDVVAPGEEIMSLGIETPDDYKTDSGTSFSCPQVASLAAMCKSIDKSIDHDKFMELLKLTSKDAGPAGYDTSYGWGIIDFGNMLDALVPEDNSIWNAKITGINKKVDYTGSKITFDNLKITMPDGTVLVKNQDYNLAYFNNKKIGEGLVVINGMGKYHGRINKYFSIVKSKKIVAPTIANISVAKTTFLISWKKQSVDGYQLQYSTTKTFKKGTCKTININKKKTSYTVKKLKAKKKYFVRMRGYKLVEDKRNNSAWTTATSLYIKKK